MRTRSGNRAKSSLASHIINRAGRPVCGAKPNSLVALPARDLRNPDVMDGVEFCFPCIRAALIQRTSRTSARKLAS